MQIGEISERFGLSSYTLRYYGKIGVIPPVKRESADCAWIAIQCMKNNGMTVQALAQYARLREDGRDMLGMKKNCSGSGNKNLLRNYLRWKKWNILYKKRVQGEKEVAAAQSVRGKGHAEESRLFTNRALGALFLPLIAEQVLNHLVGLADSMMVSYIGEAAVAGVSVIHGAIQFLTGLLAAMTTGGAVVIGQYWGNREKEKALEAVCQLVWFIGAASMLIVLLMYLLEPLFWRVLFGEIAADVKLEGENYFKIAAASLPFLAFYGAGAAIFRITGHAKTPMLIMLAMNIFNVLGNAVLGYAAGLGTTGVAISTLMARILAAGILLALLVQPGRPLRLIQNRGIRFDWLMLRRIWRVGVPFGIENGFFYMGRILVLSLVSTFGTMSIAAGSVAGSISVFTTMLGMAVNLGATAVISQCVGLGDYRQAKYYHKKIMSAVFFMHLLVNICIIAALPLVLRAYNLSEETAALTARIVIWHAVMAVFVWPLAYTQPTTFRAAGDARYPMMVGAATMLLCRVAMAYVLGSCFGMGVMGVFAAIFLDWIVKAVLFTRYYASGRWMRVSVI